MECSRVIFTKLDLKGNFTLGHLDSKHILIQLEYEGDFHRLWLKEKLFIDGFPMRIFRWTSDFRSGAESPIASIWLGFPNLPIFMFNKVSLFSLGQLIGTPLTLDKATIEFKRPSIAKLCVQVALTKDIPCRVWLECGEKRPGYWQEVVYDRIPSFCKHCLRIGHDISMCKFLDPSPSKVHVQHETKIYRKKEKTSPVDNNKQSRGSRMPSMMRQHKTNILLLKTQRRFLKAQQVPLTLKITTKILITINKRITQQMKKRRRFLKKH